MGVLEFRILGPLEVIDGDRPIRLGGPKQRATLAILLLSANRVVSVERLADDLYAGAPPAADEGLDPEPRDDRTRGQLVRHLATEHGTA